MESSGRYRDQVKQCLRKAQMADAPNARALWLGLAQSWIRLQELAAKKEIEWGSEKLTVEDGHLTSHWSP